MSQQSVSMSDSPVRRMDFRLYHGSILAICCLAFVLSFLLEVKEGQSVAFRRGYQRPLPEVCALRNWFGLDCPACGLTRSFIHLAEGSMQASLGQHRLGWLFAVAVAVQIPYRITALRTGRDKPWGRRFPSLFVGTLLALLILNWVIGFLVGG